MSERSKRAAMTPGERKIYDLKKLQDVERDSDQWGSWGIKLHKAWQQKERQYNAYEIIGRNEDIIDTKDEIGLINGYDVCLSYCSCPDFKERNLPCKHIYCLALSLNKPILITREDFINRRDAIRGLTDGSAISVKIDTQNAAIDVKLHGQQGEKINPWPSS